MIVRLNVALRNRLLDAMWNGGASAAMFDAGLAYFRTAAIPASADNAATGIVVALVALPADAMALAANGSVVKGLGLWKVVAAASGTIGWARFISADGLLVTDYDVTDLAGTGTIKLDNTTLLLGQMFSVVSFGITMPAST